MLKPCMRGHGPAEIENMIDNVRTVTDFANNEYSSPYMVADAWCCVHVNKHYEGSTYQSRWCSDIWTLQRSRKWWGSCWDQRGPLLPACVLRMWRSIWSWILAWNSRWKVWWGWQSSSSRLKLSLRMNVTKLHQTLEHSGWDEASIYVAWKNIEASDEELWRWWKYEGISCGNPRLGRQILHRSECEKWLKEPHRVDLIFISCGYKESEER